MPEITLTKEFRGVEAEKLQACFAPGVIEVQNVNGKLQRLHSVRCSIKLLSCDLACLHRTCWSVSFELAVLYALQARRLQEWLTLEKTIAAEKYYVTMN